MRIRFTLIVSVLMLACVTLSSGCMTTARSSWRYNEASVAKITEGRTTEAEAISLLGEPMHAIEQGGRRTLVWTDVTTQDRGSILPALVGYGHDVDYRTQMRSLTLHIENGIVAKKETSGSSSRMDAKARPGLTP